MEKGGERGVKNACVSNEILAKHKNSLFQIIILFKINRYSCEDVLLNILLKFIVIY